MVAFGLELSNSPEESEEIRLLWKILLTKRAEEHLFNIKASKGQVNYWVILKSLKQVMNKRSEDSVNSQLEKPGLWALSAVILFLLAGMILNPEGQLVGLVMALIPTFVLIIKGRKGWRLFGILFLILCVVAGIEAWNQKQRFDEKIQKLKSQIEQIQRSQSLEKSNSESNVLNSNDNSSKKP